jgi:hypothetical protein
MEMNSQNTSLMLQALCEAEGINVSSIIDESPSSNESSSHVMSDMPSQSEQSDHDDHEKDI